LPLAAAMISRSAIPPVLASRYSARASTFVTIALASRKSKPTLAPSAS
jgi:hypothetical protein